MEMSKCAKVFVINEFNDSSLLFENVSLVQFKKPTAPGLRPLDKKKLVVFAPGAVYDILPLWVADKSGCQGSSNLPRM